MHMWPRRDEGVPALDGWFGGGSGGGGEDCKAQTLGGPGGGRQGRGEGGTGLSLAARATRIGKVAYPGTPLSGRIEGGFGDNGGSAELQQQQRRRRQQQLGITTPLKHGRAAGEHTATPGSDPVSRRGGRQRLAGRAPPLTEPRKTNAAAGTDPDGRTCCPHCTRK